MFDWIFLHKNCFAILLSNKCKFYYFFVYERNYTKRNGGRENLPDANSKRRRQFFIACLWFINSLGTASGYLEIPVPYKQTTLGSLQRSRRCPGVIRTRTLSERSSRLRWLQIQTEIPRGVFDPPSLYARRIPPGDSSGRWEITRMLLRVSLRNYCFKVIFYKDAVLISHCTISY